MRSYRSFSSVGPNYGEHGEPGEDAASGVLSTSMSGFTRMAGLLQV
jgi:hypothetical protein